MRIFIAAFLFLAACSSDDIATGEQQSNALSLTRRQTAEIIFQAVCEQSTECQHRNAQGAPQPPVDLVAAHSCQVDLVRIYCGEEPQSCNDDELRMSNICKPRDCSALTDVMLDEAASCANALRDNNTCDSHPSCADMELYQ